MTIKDMLTDENPGVFQPWDSALCGQDLCGDSDLGWSGAEETTEKIDQFIKKQGNGSERDALNVSLARYENLRLQFVQAIKDLKEAREKIEQLMEECAELRLSNVVGRSEQYYCEQLPA